MTFLLRWGELMSKATNTQELRDQVTQVIEDLRDGKITVTEATAALREAREMLGQAVDARQHSTAAALTSLQPKRATIDPRPSPPKHHHQNRNADSSNDVLYALGHHAAARNSRTTRSICTGVFRSSDSKT